MFWRCSLLNLQYRPGFPECWSGLHKHYVFEVQLTDGSTCRALVEESEEYILKWKTADQRRVVIPEDTVTGWRETYNCDAARQDIDAYFRDPISIVAKDHLGDAFVRHIDRENCVECREYYADKEDPNRPLPLESELKELKRFVASLACVQATKGQSGPVQDTPKNSSVREIGLAILLPLPFGHASSNLDLPGEIMERVQKWAGAKGLENFGTVVAGDCPMLLIGLRQPETVTTESR